MKKLIVVLVILLAASALYADPIQLGNFPVGQWLDPNYNAVWDFSSGNIRILSPSGRVLYDFSPKQLKTSGFLWMEHSPVFPLAALKPEGHTVS